VIPPDMVILTCKSKVNPIVFIFTLKTSIIFWTGKKNEKQKSNNNKKKNRLHRLILYLQQRIPSCAVKATVDVLRRAFKNPSIVCLENVTSIATLISCVPNGSSVNVILDTD